MSTSMHPGVFDSSEHAVPPPRTATAAADERADGRTPPRYRAMMAGAIACALVAVALFDRALSPATSGALLPWLVVLAGLGAAAVSLLLGRAAYRAAGDEPADDAAGAPHA